MEALIVIVIIRLCVKSKRSALYSTRNIFMKIKMKGLYSW